MTTDLPDLLSESVGKAPNGAGLSRHRWYPLKEGFSPNLVEMAIQNEGCRRTSLLIDPFSGSGTTVVTAALNGYSALGIELNPFLDFVGRAKLSKVTPRRFKKYRGVVEAGAATGRRSELEAYSTFTEARNHERGLFNKAILRAHEGGWAATDGIPRDVSALLRLALIASAMEQCNAVRDGKALRYRQSLFDAKFDRASFASVLSRRLDEIEEDLEEAPITGQARFWRGDCRQRLRGLQGKSFRLCIMSPPYLNSFDYSDVYRPELFLGKFVKSTEELRQIRLRSIRSHVQASWPRPTETDFGSLFENCWQEIRERKDLLWDQRLPVMVQAYFQDMRSVLRKLRRHAKQGASVWLVVSTSAYAGVEIPVDLIIADLGSQSGWHLRDVHVLRQLRSSGQHWSSQEGISADDRRKPPLRESLVILDSGPIRRTTGADPLKHAS